MFSGAGVGGVGELLSAWLRGAGPHGLKLRHYEVGERGRDPGRGIYGKEWGMDCIGCDLVGCFLVASVPTH